MNKNSKSLFHGYLVTVWVTLSVSSVILGGVLAAEDASVPRPLTHSLFITIAISALSLGTGLLVLHFARRANEREKNERLLAERALRAERAAREKSLFMANMSHEIRTPMNAILGFSEMLAAELPREGKHQRRAQAIQESAVSLLRLINDILDLSKVEAGMLEIHREPSDPREIASFMRALFAQQAARKGLRWEVSVAPELPPGLLLDRARLQQVLANLLGNALKFTSQGRVGLHFRWTPEEENRDRGTLVIEVEDTGIGIPLRKRESVFQPFSQAAPLAADSGLGLSIAQRLTDRMGGQVTLESMVGRGSLFRLIFPGTAVSGPAASPAPPETEEAIDFNALPAATILVVDDEAMNRALLADMLGDTHHVLQFAATGRDALEGICTARPDVVLMDLRMPEMDGRAALAEIRKLPGGDRLPIIAVTASNRLEEEQDLRESFAGYVRKPFTRQAIFRALASLLSGPRPGAKPPAIPEKPEGGIPETPAQWPALVRELSRLELERWPEVRATGAVGDVRRFAGRLRELAQARGCPALQRYGEALQREADDYAINRIEKRLADFPDLIRVIDLRAAQASPASSR